MENLDRDKLSGRDAEKSESESGFGTSRSESWRSEPSRKSSESKQESEKVEDIDNPACGGCYY